MKVSDVNQEGKTIQSIQQAGKLTPPEKNQNDKEINPSSAKDSVYLSSEAKELEKIHDILEGTPDMRAEKVGILKKAIESGQYQIDNGTVADQMIKDALLEFNK